MQLTVKKAKLITKQQELDISMKTTLWIIIISGLLIGTDTVSAQNSVDPYIDPNWPATAARQRIPQARTRLMQLEQQRISALQEYTLNSPNVRSIERQIANLRRQIKRASAINQIPKEQLIKSTSQNIRP